MITLIKYLKIAWDNRFTILAIGLFILAILFLRTCDSNRRLKQEMAAQKAQFAQNTAALTDTVKAYKDKAGRIEYMISSYVTDIDGLKSMNKDLYDEVRNINGKVESIIKSQTKASLPPSIAGSSLFRYTDDTNKYGIKFSYTYNDLGLHTKVAGISSFRYFQKSFFNEQTTIDTNQISMDLTYAFTRIGDTLKAVGKCPSKYVSISGIQGSYIIDSKSAILDIPKKRRWNISVSAGYMYVPTINKFQPAIGLTAGYSLFNWGK